MIHICCQFKSDKCDCFDSFPIECSKLGGGEDSFSGILRIIHLVMTTKIMANKNGLLLHLLLLLLASSQFHCRSVPGDYDTEMHATASSLTEFQVTSQFQQSNADAETFAAEWDSQTTVDTPSFAIQTDEPSYDYSATADDDTTAAPSWEQTGLDSTPTGAQNTSSPASPGSETEFTVLADDDDDETVTFIDSPEIVEDADASGVDDEATPYSDPSGTPTAEAYANDEVYFDTSDADTIYKSSDE